MLFSFLKYVKPIWYLNLRTSNSNPFLDYRLLNGEEKALIDYCSDYSAEDVSLLDAAIQAWFKGFIDSGSDRCLTVLARCDNRDDNYRFLRRFFSPLWSWYTLGIRLVTLHNPVAEFRSFLKHTRVSRLDLYEKIVKHPLTLPGRPESD